MNKKGKKQMESINFFKTQCRHKKNAESTKKSRNIKISGVILSKIDEISEKSGMNPTSICNMVLSDFVASVFLEEEAKTAPAAKNPNPKNLPNLPNFDPDKFFDEVNADTDPKIRKNYYDDEINF